MPGCSLRRDLGLAAEHPDRGLNRRPAARFPDRRPGRGRVPRALAAFGMTPQFADESARRVKQPGAAEAAGAASGYRSVSATTDAASATSSSSGAASSSSWRDRTAATIGAPFDGQITAMSLRPP